MIIIYIKRRVAGLACAENVRGEKNREVEEGEKGDPVGEDEKDGADENGDEEDKNQLQMPYHEVPEAQCQGNSKGVGYLKIRRIAKNILPGDAGASIFFWIGGHYLIFPVPRSVSRFPRDKQVSSYHGTRFLSNILL
jgi:hypothetical protein